MILCAIHTWTIAILTCTYHITLTCIKHTVLTSTQSLTLKWCTWIYERNAQLFLIMCEMCYKEYAWLCLGWFYITICGNGNGWKSIWEIIKHKCLKYHVLPKYSQCLIQTSLPPVCEIHVQMSYISEGRACVRDS